MARSLSILLLSIAVLMAASPAGAAAEADPRVAAMLEGIVADGLMAHVDSLVAFGTRRWDQPGARQAQEWLLTAFADLGLDEVYAHDFDGGSDNVIGILRGSERPERIHVLGAHYDSVVWSGPATGPAPGADDNASGTAAVLEAARAIVGLGGRPAETILFVAFTAEEPGLWGSEALVADLAESDADIVDMINLDVIGYLEPGTRLDLSVTSESFTSGVRALVERISEVAAAYLPDRPFEVGDPPVCRQCSDHAPFVLAGYPAVTFFEDLEHFCPFMHTTLDVVGIGLNSPELLEAHARVAAAAIATFAGPFGPSEQPTFRRGDAAADGTVDVTDAIAILRYLLLQGDAPGCLDAADANDDGDVDISDPIRILLALFVSGDPLAPPTCGPDPTADALGCAARAACP